MMRQNRAFKINDDRKCNKLHISESCNTELNVYAQVLCCTQFPFIFHVKIEACIFLLRFTLPFLNNPFECLVIIGLIQSE